MPQWLSSLRPHRLLADLGGAHYQDVLDQFISIGAAGAEESQVGAKIAELLQPVGVTLTGQAPADTNPLSVSPGMERFLCLARGSSRP